MIDSLSLKVDVR